MTSQSVLISGAGVAGPTLAYWLARHGFQPTVVERSQDLRSSGNPVDVRGPAIPVAEEMGVMPRLRAAATQATAMSVVDATGRQVARIKMPAARGGDKPEVELPRGDLANALYETARDDAEFLFDDTIVTLRQDADGVDVTFGRAAPRRFDLVIGADGLHSTVRRLEFGPENDFVTHVGLYVATLPLDGPADPPHDLVLYNTPGKLVALHPGRGRAWAAFIFRSPAIPGFDHRDTDQHKRIVAEAYAGAGWRVPELIEQVRKAEDLYFDSVSSVRLTTWARGRIALLGDAASCMSLLGDGSTLAMVGARTLARALGEESGHAAAFRRYEAEHRILVAPKQRNVGRAAGLLVPKTRLGITTRNLTARVLLGR
ncbi:FAD-dependent monooxygenase [Nonomuraea jiangxiensis]|uniref:2-polyprenyl-6-methoxyphenol hydroxylase n=1 Tax=Nonomuraea jiangxiensis TaxID=633440 RepID=A0A1G8DEC3_9ACTN|nr:FAD-dependent monooxygenase [Nonomuraea jiangxiensis]SDH56077.1 2-polyprenyl-6-methoxyphenol hydroxylase [Nonomuraea jiangxiensis]